MQKHKEMLDERTTSLGESLKNLINRLVDVDYSPYLEVGTLKKVAPNRARFITAELQVAFDATSFLHVPNLAGDIFFLESRRRPGLY